MYLLTALLCHEGISPYSAVTVEAKVILLRTVRRHELHKMMDGVNKANASSVSPLNTWPTTARRNREMAEGEHMSRMFVLQSTSKTGATCYICINEGQGLRALVASGCQQSVVCLAVPNTLAIWCTGATVVVRMLNGQFTESLEEVRIRLGVFGRFVDLVCFVSSTLVYDCSVIPGMVGILKLATDLCERDGKVSLSNAWDGHAVATGERSVTVNDRDFAACFYGEKWRARWK